MVEQSNTRPAVITIFGITGDLARKKVLPSLYQLFKGNILDAQTYIVGTSRHQIDSADILNELRQTLVAADSAVDEDTMIRLGEKLRTAQLEPDQSADFVRLNEQLQALEDEAGTCLERYFYLSIPPQVYGTFIKNLGEQGLNQSCKHGTAGSNLLVEKPFGYDYTSAQQLIDETAQYFSEEQLYRIDHYLAKETAQNIFTFRDKNPLFNQIWNSQHITKISISAAEQIGIAGRTNFYDQVGALRDVVQSHLMQLLAITLMEIPDELNAASIHAAKQAVLDALISVPVEKVNERGVRGQYDTYRQEVNDPNSNTETFASVVLYSQDPNWQDVPLKLTTGKGLRERHASITVDFGAGGVNRLEFRIQPNEGITLTLQVKQPGLEETTAATTMDFDYQTAFQVSEPLDAYERVLVTAIRGDHTLFATSEEVLASWRVLEPVLTAWQNDASDIALYQSGSDGPDVTHLP